MHSIALRSFKRPQMFSSGMTLIGSKSQNLVTPMSSSLYTTPQYFFCLNWGRNRSRTRVKFTEFGSLEEENNAQYDVTHTPPIHRDSLRCGAIGYKIGMTHIFGKWGESIPCTVIQLDRCQVIQIKEDIDGKLTHKIQVGAGEGNIKTIKKAQLGHFLNAGVPIKKHTAEFQVTRENFLPVGYMIGPSFFKVGNFVDVQGTTKGKGFQGTIKRWNFKHQAFTHGNHKAHRAPGALQGCTEPGKVFKGKKMAGQMGNKNSTQFSSKVIRVDTPRSLLYVKGSVPGSIGGLVKIRDAHKKMHKQIRSINDVTTGIDTWEGEEEDPIEATTNDGI